MTTTRNNVIDYVNVTATAMEKSGPSPCEFDDKDDFVDAVMDAGVSAWGRPNAAQKSALEKFAREDWEQYHNC